MPSQMRTPAALLGVVGLFGSGFAAASPATPAQPAPPPPVSASPSLGLPQARQITLAEALAYARNHQPAVLASLARIRTEKANAEVPRSQYYPLVGITAQFLEGTTNNTTASYLGDPFVELPRIGGTPSRTSSDASWRPYASTLAAAGLSQEIFDFGRIAAEAAAADARVTIAAHAADTQLLDIELNVEEAFFAVHAAKSILQASEDAYQRSLVHRNFASAGRQVGPPLADRADARRGGPEPLRHRPDPGARRRLGRADGSRGRGRLAGSGARRGRRDARARPICRRSRTPFSSPPSVTRACKRRWRSFVSRSSKRER